jgi:peroxiredoxin
MMRNFFKVLFLLYLPCKLFAQDKEGYTIEGHIGGLKEGEKVSMMLATNKGTDFFDNLIESEVAYVKNGTFQIKGIVPEGPRRYLMTFDKHPKRINLYIDNGERITIRTPNIDSLKHSYVQHYVEIDGSPTNYSLFCLQPAEEIYYQSLGQLSNYSKKIKDSVGFNGPLLGSVIQCREAVNKAFYLNLFDVEGDPEVIKSNLFLPTDFQDFRTSGHASFWINVYNSLNEHAKNSFYGKYLKDLIQVCVGKPFPEFNLPQENGQLLRLKDVVAKGKVTIISLWHSQSLNRKEYQDELVPYYHKYHDKGLNIIAISSDESVNKWKEAIMKEKYPWYNVLNENGKNIDKLVGIQGAINGEGTPNALLDSEGKIIAWDVHGVDLEWYLWKIFGSDNITTASASTNSH